jgi:4-hydroxybenzoate polyprenyltransferase
MVEIDRRRPPRRPRERAMSRPDRVALWAVLLCLLLLVVAATSAHAATGMHPSVAHHAAATVFSLRH